jgi:hypothetical protein
MIKRSDVMRGEPEKEKGGNKKKDKSKEGRLTNGPG